MLGLESQTVSINDFQHHHSHKLTVVTRGVDRGSAASHGSPIPRAYTRAGAQEAFTSSLS